MRDYEELVNALRENAEWAEGNIWEVPIMLPDNLKQAADAIEELSKPKWISVEERLPEEGKNVLVCICADGKYDITRGWYDKKQGFCCWDDAAMESADFITHWMPLPSTEGLNET
jgi:hypothetical protein